MEEAQPQPSKPTVESFEPVPNDVLKMLPEGLIKRNLVIPLEFKDGKLLAGVPDLGAVIKPEGLKIVTGCPVEVLTFPAEQIAAFIKKHFVLPAETEARPAPVESQPETQPAETPVSVEKSAPTESVQPDPAPEPVQLEPEPLSPPSSMESPVLEEKVSEESPVLQPAEPEVPEVKREEGEEKEQLDSTAEPVETPRPEETRAVGPLAQALIQLAEEAVRQRSTEMLVSLRDNDLSFRHRIKGVWIKPEETPRLSIDQMTTLLKAFRELKTARKVGDALWSEGEKNILVGGRPHHCRFVMTESDKGALISLRAAQRKESLFDPRTWGMDSRQIDILTHLFRRPRGVIGFCGANDEDVKEIFNASLRQLASPGRPGILVVDEEEEWFPDVDQFSSGLNEEAFSTLLESSLHQAPELTGVSPLGREADVLRVLQAGLKRNLILGRFFADDAAELLYELSLMKIDNHLMGTALNGVVTVRAIRYLCQKCIAPDPVGVHVAKEMGIPPAMQPSEFYIGKGCDHCRGTGFDKVGRLFEVVELNDDIRRLIYSKLPPAKLRGELKASHVRTLRQVAVHKAINGQTSLAEVLRVTRK